MTQVSSLHRKRQIRTAKELEISNEYDIMHSECFKSEVISKSCAVLSILCIRKRGSRGQRPGSLLSMGFVNFN